MDMQEFFAGLDKLFASGRAEDASQYLLTSLQRARDEGDRSATVSILNEMAGYYRSVSMHTAAIATAEAALEEIAKIDDAHPQALGATLLNAATAHRAGGGVDRALELYGQALEIFRAHLAPDDPHLAALYNNMSQAHQEKGENDAARALLEQALRILERREDGRIEASIVRSNLALIYMRLDRMDDAARELEQALAVYEADSGAARKDPHYAAALSAMAEARYRMGRYGEALALYEAAIDQITANFGENEDCAAVCRNCASACEALGWPDKAAAYLQRADDIACRIGGSA